ncbi:MAG: hypothetical protein Q8O95_02480 [bacterium]|nr:hypothetical protein [bacterium]
MHFNPVTLLIILVVLILCFGLYVVFHRRQRISAQEAKQIRKFWQEIFELRSEYPDQAVLKADKLLDHALKQAGYTGTMGEKMKQARAVFRDNNGVWSAHKLRNRIAHEIHVKVSPIQANTALTAFKKAFIDLGISL